MEINSSARQLLDPGWVPVFSGLAPVVGIIQSALEQAKFTVVRTYAGLGSPFPVGVVGTDQMSSYTIAIPQAEYEARRLEVEAIVTQTAAGPGDETALIEAEEEYDVRGCPVCRVYFYRDFSVCPGCGQELLPAVECLEPSEAEPERVIVAAGDAETTSPLAKAFTAAGFEVKMREWPNSTIAISLPWRQVTGRLEEVEAFLLAAYKSE